MQASTVIRLIEGRLAWYPPGAGGEPEWLDDDAAAVRLRAILSRRGPVCFAAPGADVRTLVMDLGAGEKRHIVRSLPFLLEEQLTQDVEQMHFASLQLSPEQLAVALVSREQMLNWQRLLEPFAGIAAWRPEPMLLPWQPGEWCLVIELAQTVVRVGECEGFTAELSLLPAMLESRQKDDSVPTAIIIYGTDQASDISLIPQALRDRVQWRSGGFSSALLLHSADTIGPNLLQGEFAPRLPLGRWWRQWRAVAAVAVLAFALQLLATYVDYRGLKQENLALRTAVEQSYRRAYPQGVVVDAEKQLRRQLEAMRGSSQSSGFVSLMDRVGAVVASQPGTQIASINYNDKADEMRMNILAADYEAVEQVRAQINEIGLEAIMESSSAQGDKVRARLRVGERT